MGKKLTIEDVKKFIQDNDIENNCILLSTEYVNSATPLLFQCNICGKHFKRDYNHLKRGGGRFKCEECANKTKSNKQRLSIQDVEQYIKQNDIEHNCTLLSIDYINSITPMKFQCNKCGKIFYRDYNHLTRGQGRFQCEKCGVLQGAKTKKYTKEMVQEDIQQKRGYILLGDYVDAQTPVLTQCVRGHQFNLVYSQFLQGRSGCEKCAVINRSGKNHWNYQNGGYQEVLDYLRDRIKIWKNKKLKEANYLCDICHQQTNNLVVHHIINFRKLVDEASKQSKIPLLQKVSDYYEQNIPLELLVDKLLELHETAPAVVIDKKYHDEFHRIYGKVNNTLEQYLEYKNNCMNNYNY